jgi:hypothetical protein
MIGPIATALQLFYALSLVCIGAFGMLTLEWELARFYGIDVLSLSGQEGATLLNQFRFLKAIELSFGLYSLAFRRDIMAGGLACTLFLCGLGLGAFARGMSMVLDGWPDAAFVAFFAAEVIIFVFVFLNARLVAENR